jgi:hypothetical protein
MSGVSPTANKGLNSVDTRFSASASRGSLSASASHRVELFKSASRRGPRCACDADAAHADGMPQPMSCILLSANPQSSTALTQIKIFFQNGHSRLRKLKPCFRHQRTNCSRLVQDTGHAAQQEDHNTTSGKPSRSTTSTSSGAFMASGPLSLSGLTTREAAWSPVSPSFAKTAAPLQRWLCHQCHLE